MALGKKCSSLKPKRGVASGEDVLGLGFVRYNRGLGRKRILITNVVETSSFDSAIRTPLKRQCSDKMVDLDCDERSRLEALPQDILVSIKNLPLYFILILNCKLSKFMVNNRRFCFYFCRLGFYVVSIMKT